MTSDERAFLRAIATAPDHDTPRLIFADWLDDHGESERAAVKWGHAEARRLKLGAWADFH